jgi:two-component system, OmpR family, sensor histidine kinase VicK
LLENQAEITKELRRLNNNANGLSVCSLFGGMQMSHGYLYATYTRIVEEDRKGKGDRMRWIVNVEGKDNLELVRIFGNMGIQIRSVKNMPPMNFGVSDKQLAETGR